MNSLSRYLLKQSVKPGDSVTLQGDEAHHAARVRRVKMGDEVELFDGEGNAAVSEVVSVSKNFIEMVILEVRKQPRMTLEMTLIQSIPKSGNMELIIQKAVELGVTAIQPIISENTVARAEQSEKKLLKWQRIALEACKQCGQNFLPEVRATLTLSEWLRSRERADKEIVAALDDRSSPIKEKISGKLTECKSIYVLVGPEGDFSKSEYDSLHAEGMEFVSIGDIVLRVETATLFCISALKYEAKL